MGTRKRIPAPPARVRPAEPGDDTAEAERRSELGPRRAPLTRRELRADTDLTSYAVKGKSHRARDD